MKYAIIFTETAQTDLSAIFQYIAVDLQSVQNASHQLARLEKAIASLEEMPERHRVYDWKNWRERHLHIMLVDHYLVFYITTQEDFTVTIMRILYGGRDIDSQLALLETK